MRVRHGEIVIPLAGHGETGLLHGLNQRSSIRDRSSLDLLNQKAGDEPARVFLYNQPRPDQGFVYPRRLALLSL